MINTITSSIIGSSLVAYPMLSEVHRSSQNFSFSRFQRNLEFCDPCFRLPCRIINIQMLNRKSLLHFILFGCSDDLLSGSRKRLSLSLRFYFLFARAPLLSPSWVFLFVSQKFHSFFVAIQPFLTTSPSLTLSIYTDPYHGGLSLHVSNGSKYEWDGKEK